MERLVLFYFELVANDKHRVTEDVRLLVLPFACLFTSAFSSYRPSPRSTLGSSIDTLVSIIQEEMKSLLLSHALSYT